MSNVVKFQPVEVGSDYRFDPDETLELAKGLGFRMLVILGELPDGSIHVSGSANAGEAMMLIEMAKHKIVFGER